MVSVVLAVATLAATWLGAAAAYYFPERVTRLRLTPRAAREEDDPKPLERLRMWLSQPSQQAYFIGAFGVAVGLVIRRFTPGTGAVPLIPVVAYGVTATLFVLADRAIEPYRRINPSLKGWLQYTNWDWAVELLSSDAYEGDAQRALVLLRLAFGGMLASSLVALFWLAAT